MVDLDKYEGFPEKSYIEFMIDNGKEMLNYPNGISLKPWKECTIVTFDLETTSHLPDKAKIIQFCGIKTKLVDGKAKELSRLSMFIDPQQELEEITTKITGITDQDVQGQKTWAEAQSEIISFLLSSDMICGYNIIGYDLAVLQNEYHLNRNNFWPVCLDLAVWAVYFNDGKMKGTKQEDTAKIFGVQRMSAVAHGETRLHDAVIDTEICSDLLWEMGKKIHSHSTIDLLTDQVNLVYDHLPGKLRINNMRKSKEVKALEKAAKAQAKAEEKARKAEEKEAAKLKKAQEKEAAKIAKLANKKGK